MSVEFVSTMSLESFVSYVPERFTGNLSCFQPIYALPRLGRSNSIEGAVLRELVTLDCIVRHIQVVVARGFFKDETNMV